MAHFWSSIKLVGKATGWAAGAEQAERVLGASSLHSLDLDAPPGHIYSATICRDGPAAARPPAGAGAERLPETGGIGLLATMKAHRLAMRARGVKPRALLQLSHRLPARCPSKDRQIWRGGTIATPPS
jgi:hypothetical protein